MAEKRAEAEDELAQLLEESKSENDALKRLLTALHEQELLNNLSKTDAGEISNNTNK